MAHAPTIEPQSTCWFRLPPGFIDLEPGAWDELEARMSDGLAFLHQDARLPGERSPRARVFLELLADLYDQGMMHLAFGIHTGGSRGVCTSVFSLSDVPTNAATRVLAAAQCGLQLVAHPFGTVLRRDLVDLPCGMPAALVTCLLPEPPDHVREKHAETPSDGSGVFQARLGIARPSGSRVVLIDLTTTEVELADEYTEILLGIGRTVSFTDPTPQSAAPMRHSRVLEVLR
ncbi:hypothetical protein ACQEVG_32430 [Streptomyces sp. CA-135486]|uniref:hypothetical protein n=1 Tax=Streptomyces sp. CA-135486 TaxID=3240049 RepID=UPI003D8AB340